jgi:hypothetical protein
MVKGNHSTMSQEREQKRPCHEVKECVCCAEVSRKKRNNDGKSIAIGLAALGVLAVGASLLLKVREVKAIERQNESD